MRNLIDELEREVAHSDSMKAAAEMWMARAQAAERQLLETTLALVTAAGGRIVVEYDHLIHLPELELIRTEIPERHHAIEFRVRRLKPLTKGPLGR